MRRSRFGGEGEPGGCGAGSGVLPGKSHLNGTAAKAWSKVPNDVAGEEGRDGRYEFDVLRGVNE